MLSMVNGEVYAIDAVCSHEGGPLEEGTFEGYEVECPWHGSKFDVRTGEVKNPPAETPQSVYEVKVETNDILVRKKPEAQGQPLRHEITSGATTRGKGASTVYELTLLENKTLKVLILCRLSLTGRMSNKEDQITIIKHPWVIQQDSSLFSISVELAMILRDQLGILLLRLLQLRTLL